VSLSNAHVTDAIDLSAAEFTNSFWLRNIVFEGRLTLNSCAFVSSLKLDDCAFNAGMDISQSSFGGGISFVGCEFGLAGQSDSRPIFRFDRAHVNGDLQLISTNLHGHVSGRGSIVDGDVYFACCTINGSQDGSTETIHLDVSDIRGSLLFTSDWPKETVSRYDSRTRKPPLTKRRSVVRQSKKGTCLSLRRTHIRDFLDFGCAQFEGSILMQHLDARAVSSNGEIFPSATSLASDGLPFDVFTAHIDGDLAFGGARIGYIQFHGITITGAMLFFGGSSGQINIDDWLDRKANCIIDARIGAFIMTAWHCTDFLRCNAVTVSLPDAEIASRHLGVDISSSQIDKDVTFWPGLVTQSDLQEDFCSKPVHPPFDHNRLLVRETGGIRISTEPRSIFDRWRRYCQIQGKLRIVGCTIRHDLNLTGVRVTARGGDGSIIVTDTQIGGRVLFLTPVSYLNDSLNEQPLLRALALCHIRNHLLYLKTACAQACFSGDACGERGQFFRRMRLVLHEDHPIHTPCMRSSCSKLDMCGIVANDIDITGLTIPASWERNGDRDPSALFSYARVNRRFQAFCRLSATQVEQASLRLTRMADGGKEHRLLNACLGMEFDLALGQECVAIGSHAVITGSLDLQRAAIGELWISDHSFRRSALSSRAKECGIVLDFAKIRSLHVARGRVERRTKDVTNGFPAPLSLLDLEVGAWSLQPLDSECSVARDSREANSAAPYLDLLDNDPEYRTSTYTTVERALRNRGLEEQADWVYIAGRYRDARTYGPHLVRNKMLLFFSELRRIPPWRPGFGRYRRAAQMGLLPVWRLRRPVEECIGLVIGFLWILVMTCAIFVITDPPRWFLYVLMFVSLLLMPFALRGLTERLYWTLLNYGSGAGRLAILMAH
jgi:hypothetical protein